MDPLKTSRKALRGARLLQINGAIDRAMDCLHALHDQDELSEEILELSSGFASLDAYTEGFQPNELIVVAGRMSLLPAA